MDRSLPGNVASWSRSVDVSADTYRRAVHVAQGTPLTENDLRRMNAHGSWPRIAGGLQYLYAHIHQVPAIVIPAVEGRHRPRERDRAGRDLGLHPARRLELHARRPRPRPWPRHGLDHRAGPHWNANWPRCSVSPTTTSCSPRSSRSPSPSAPASGPPNASAAAKSCTGTGGNRRRFTRSGPSLRAVPSARCHRWSPGRRTGCARRSRGPFRLLRLASPGRPARRRRRGRRSGRRRR